mgnify:CR=1 FL=1
MYEIKNLAKKTLNKKILTDFLDFTNNELEIEKPYSVYFVDDKVNAADPLGRTAMYNPSTSSVYVYATNRHFKDILRSIAHELMHHKQNCDGRLDITDEEGSDNLMELESEAQMAGILVRMFEDGRKKGLQEQKDESENLKLKQDLSDINKKIKKLKARQEREGRSFAGMADLQNKKDAIIKKIKSTEKKEFAAQAVKAGYPNDMPSWAKELYDSAKNAYNSVRKGGTYAPYADKELGYQIGAFLKKCSPSEEKIGAYCFPKGVNLDIINKETGYPTNYKNWSLNDVKLANKMIKRSKSRQQNIFVRSVKNKAVRELIFNYDQIIQAINAFKLAPLPPDNYLELQEEYILDNLPLMKKVILNTNLNKIPEYKKAVEAYDELLIKYGKPIKEGSIKEQQGNSFVAAGDAAAAKRSRGMEGPSAIDRFVGAFKKPSSNTNFKKELEALKKSFKTMKSLGPQSQAVDPKKRGRFTGIYSFPQTEAAYTIFKLDTRDVLKFGKETAGKLPEKLKLDLFNLARSDKNEPIKDVTARAAAIYGVSPFGEKSSRAVDEEEKKVIDAAFMALSFIAALPFPYFWLIDLGIAGAYFTRAANNEENRTQNLVDGTISLVFGLAFSGALRKAGSKQISDIGRMKEGFAALFDARKRAELIRKKGLEAAGTQIEAAEKLLDDALEAYDGARQGAKNAIETSGPIGDEILEPRLRAVKFAREELAKLGTEAGAVGPAIDRVRKARTTLRQEIRKKYDPVRVIQELRNKKIKIDGGEYPWWYEEVIEENARFIDKQFESIWSTLQKKGNPYDFQKTKLMPTGKTREEAVRKVAEVDTIEFYANNPTALNGARKRFDLKASEAVAKDLNATAEAEILASDDLLDRLVKGGTKAELETLEAEIKAVANKYKPSTNIVDDIVKKPEKTKKIDPNTWNPEFSELVGPDGKLLNPNPVNVPGGYRAIKKGEKWSIEPIGGDAAVQAAKDPKVVFKPQTVKSSEEMRPFLRLKYTKMGSPFRAKRVGAELDVFLSPLSVKGTGAFGRAVQQFLFGNRLATNLLSTITFKKGVTVMERLRILRGARRAAKEAYNAARKAGKDVAEAKALGKTAAKDFYAKSGFNATLFVLDKTAGIAIAKLHIFLVLYVRFYRPICGATPGDYQKFVQDRLTKLLSFANLAKYDPKTQKLTKLEKQLGIDFIKNKYKSDASIWGIGSCKEMRESIRKDVKLLDGMAKAWVGAANAGIDTATDVANEVLDNPEVKAAKEAIEQNIKKGVDVVSEAGVDLAQAATGTDAQRQALGDKYNKLIQDNGRELGQKAKNFADKVGQAASRSSTVKNIISGADRAAQQAQNILKTEYEKGSLEDEPEEPNVDPVQRGRQEESVSISDYRKKLLEERLEKLTIGLIK